MCLNQKSASDLGSIVPWPSKKDEMPTRSRTVLVTWALIALLLASPSLAFGLSIGKIARKAASWGRGFLISYGANKVLDHAIGQDFRSQLEQEIPFLVEKISTATGVERNVLVQHLNNVEAQVTTLDRLLALSRREGAQLASEVDDLLATQNRILRAMDAVEGRVTALEKRTDRLEGRVDQLDERVADLEEALIGECLDLRHAPRIGADGFHVRESARSVLEETYDSDNFYLSTRAYLNACTPDLRQRGLLLQLSWVTRDLDQDLALYTTFKHIEQSGFDAARMNTLTRLEYPLGRPTRRIDGQVLEIFLPYGEILPATNRLALALVITHDGGPIYALADRVMNCSFGQRVQCRWGR